MAKERTIVRMQKQIKIMSEQEHSIRTIARAPKLSCRTVRKYLVPAPRVTERTGGWEEQIGIPVEFRGIPGYIRAVSDPWREFA
jgi:hypothetical protein